MYKWDNPQVINFTEKAKNRFLRNFPLISNDIIFMSIPKAAWSKVWVYGHLLAKIVGSNPTRGWMSVSVRVVCCYKEISASAGWSLVQRSPTKCRVSECDCEASIMRRPWSTRNRCTKNHHFDSSKVHLKYRGKFHKCVSCFSCTTDVLWVAPLKKKKKIEENFVGK